MSFSGHQSALFRRFRALNTLVKLCCLFIFAHVAHFSAARMNYIGVKATNASHLERLCKRKYKHVAMFPSSG